jgi:hypothetical protein
MGEGGAGTGEADGARWRGPLGSLEKLGHVYDGLNYTSDFPGGEWRRMQKPTGMRYSLVNDAVTFENNACTGGLPGQLLQSYDMID